MNKIITSIIIMLLLSSCGEEKSGDVISNSPNGRVKLSITAKRDNSLSPWKVTMLAEGKGLKGNVDFEFYGSEVSNKTISFVWDKDQMCTITFTERDKSQRIFEFTPNGTDAMWRDVSPK